MDEVAKGAAKGAEATRADPVANADQAADAVATAGEAGKATAVGTAGATGTASAVGTASDVATAGDVATTSDVATAGEVALGTEAAKVLRRLDRIDALGREEVPPPPGALLGELRALVREAEAWVRLEGDARAASAVEKLRAGAEGMS